MASTTTTTTDIPATTTTTPYHNPTANQGFEHFLFNDQLPYVTGTLPGIGGAIKNTPSHFKVTEIPPPPPDNVSNKGGCHFWTVIERQNMTTWEVQDLLAKLLGHATAKEIGVSGLKDKHAVTVQTFSIPSYTRAEQRHITAQELVDQIHTASNGTLTVLGTPLVSSKKLRRNMHLGNRFEIVVDDLSTDSKTALARATGIQSMLGQTGWPNYYGEQRFSKGTRSAVRGGRLLAAVQTSARGGTRKRLRSSITNSQVRSMQLSAYSSMYFNIWLSKRIEQQMFHCLVDGDIVGKLPEVVPRLGEKKEEGVGEGGATTEAVAVAEEKATPTSAPTTTTKKSKYIPPLRYSTTTTSTTSSTSSSSSMLNEFNAGVLTYTGPMLGFRVELPHDNTPSRLLEDEALQQSNIDPNTYKMVEMYGTRRHGRMSLASMDLTITEQGGGEGDGKGQATSSRPGLLFSFTLPNGSYATTFLREFMKVPVQRRTGEDDDQEEEEEEEREQQRLKKKRKQKQAAPVPLPWVDLQTRLGHSAYTVVKCTAGEETPLEYKMLLLKSNKGKTRAVYLCLDGVETFPPIEQWSMHLKEKKSCRLANMAVMKKKLGVEDVSVGLWLLLVVVVVVVVMHVVLLGMLPFK